MAMAAFLALQPRQAKSRLVAFPNKRLPLAGKSQTGGQARGVSDGDEVATEDPAATPGLGGHGQALRGKEAAAGAAALGLALHDHGHGAAQAILHHLRRVTMGTRVLNGSNGNKPKQTRR